MADIRSFFQKEASVAEAGEPPAPAAVPEETQQETPRKKLKVKDPPVVLKLLAVKREGEAPGFCSKPEYTNHIKYVVCTHRQIRVRAEGVVIRTVQQRGQIDAIIGEYDEFLGCDELLALADAAAMIVELLTESVERRVVVVTYRNKGAHGAYLLGKLAWSMMCNRNKILSDATKVGEPGKWLYSDLWKQVKTVKGEKLPAALEAWYRAH